jgi:3-phosphoshikimate 1-carboxyvinyltransferase
MPGDKSISHRALLVAAMARGTSRIEGLGQGRDVLSTAAALRAMGVAVERGADGAWSVHGTGHLLQPSRALDMGNSGTSARLLMGLIASHPITATLVGDASLSRRPMRRAIAPLARLGARIHAAPGGRLPLTLSGACPALALEHRLEIASAQVKTALLLAGLGTPGVTRIVEPVRTRDHGERMLRLFGAELDIDEGQGERRIAIRGEVELSPRKLSIPGDPSAAAFLAVAALLVPGSDLFLPGICVNPGRIGLFHLLQAMGGDLAFSNPRELDGEPVADLRVRHAPLAGIDVPPEAAPAMIDEYPIFFVAAAFACGTSRARGLAELRVKESDRLSAMARGLAAIGARVEESEDSLTIHGTGGAPLPGGASIASRLDHRIAMAFAVAGLRCRDAIGIDDMSPVETSFPGFATLLEGLTR